MCSAGDLRGVNVQKQCGQKRMTVHAEGGCSWYANRGRCSRKGRCCPRVVASEYLVKSNNGIFVRKCECLYLIHAIIDFINYFYVLINETILVAVTKTSWCSCTKKYAKQKSKQVKRTCLGINLSQDAIADLWNVPRVCDRSYCVISQNLVRFQEESTNVEKLVQEETTSSSYVDAKNCFVQDACIQTVCEDLEETCVERFSNLCEKDGKETTKELPKDSSFVFYEHEETQVVGDTFDQISLNCDCELSIVEEHTKSTNVGTSTSMEQVDKSCINEVRSATSSCGCIPYVPELLLESKCDCYPKCVEKCLEGNEIKSRESSDHKSIENGYRRSRLYNTRNYWNSEVTTPSSCESNQYTSNNLRSTTSTESIAYSRAMTKQWRGTSMFIEKQGKIGDSTRRRHEETILRNSMSPLNHKINAKWNYSNRNRYNRFTCHCGSIGQKVISDDRFENTATSRSGTSFSSTSPSSYDRDRSPRSFKRYNTYCRHRNVSSIASDASICTGNRKPEIEYRHVKEFSKTLNPLSTLTDGNNNNGRFRITKLSYQRAALSVLPRRWKENRERRMNDTYY